MTRGRDVGAVMWGMHKGDAASCCGTNGGDGGGMAAELLVS